MLYNLDEHDSKEIANFLMDKFKISIIPDRFDYSAETISKDSNIKNVEKTAINYLLYKLNSADGIIPEDVNIFQAASLKADLFDNEIILSKKEIETTKEGAEVPAINSAIELNPEAYPEEPVVEQSEDVPVAQEPVIDEDTQKESIPEPEVVPIINELTEVKAVEEKSVVEPKNAPVIEGPAQEIVEEVHNAESETSFAGENPSSEPQPAPVIEDPVKADVAEEPIEGEIAPEKPKNPFSRIVACFTQKPNSGDSISIEATDVKGNNSKEKDSTEEPKKELTDN